MEYLKRDYLLRPQHIVSICHVSERTARRWISGETTIPAPMKRLLELELSGRIMPRKWPSHWRFNHIGALETETCHPALAWQQLTWYSYAIEGWATALRAVPEIQRSIEYLMNKLPKADVVRLAEYRKQLDDMYRPFQLTPEDAVRLARGMLDDQPGSETSEPQREAALPPGN